MTDQKPRFVIYLVFHCSASQARLCQRLELGDMSVFWKFRAYTYLPSKFLVVQVGSICPGYVSILGRPKSNPQHTTATPFLLNTFLRCRCVLLTTALVILAFLFLGCAAPAGKTEGIYMEHIKMYLMRTFCSSFEQWRLRSAHNPVFLLSYQKWILVLCETFILTKTGQAVSENISQFGLFGGVNLVSRFQMVQQKQFDHQAKIVLHAQDIRILCSF